MLIDSERRYQTMIRAMEDVVVPALGGASAQAKEQAQLVLLHLKFLLAEADEEFDFQLAEMRHYADLVEALRHVETPGDSAHDGEAAMLLEDVRPFEAVPISTRRKVRELIARGRAIADTLLKSQLAREDAQSRRETARIVIEHARRQITRDRVFVRSIGLDIDADKLPDPETVVRDRF